MIRRADSCQINSNYETNSNDNQQSISGISTPFYVKDILNFSSESNYTDYDASFVKCEQFDYRDYTSHQGQPQSHWEPHYMMYQHDSSNYETYNNYYHPETTNPHLNNNCAKFENGYVNFQPEMSQIIHSNLPPYPSNKTPMTSASKVVENMSK